MEARIKIDALKAIAPGATGILVGRVPWKMFSAKKLVVTSPESAPGHANHLDGIFVDMRFGSMYPFSTAASIAARVFETEDTTPVLDYPDVFEDHSITVTFHNRSGKPFWGSFEVIGDRRDTVLVHHPYAPRQSGMRRTIFGFDLGLDAVKCVDCKKVVHPAGAIAPGTQRMYVTRPQETVKPEYLLSGVADHRGLKLVDFRVGVQMCLGAPIAVEREMPIVKHSGRDTDGTIDQHTVQVSQDVVVVVENTSDEPRAYAPCVVGVCLY